MKILISLIFGLVLMISASANAFCGGGMMYRDPCGPVCAPFVHTCSIKVVKQFGTTFINRCPVFINRCPCCPEVRGIFD